MPTEKNQDIDKIKKTILEYLKQLTSMPGISYSTKLIESRIIDSLNLVQLIIFIESNFGLKIRMFGIHLENFATIDVLAAYILEKTGNKKVFP